MVKLTTIESLRFPHRTVLSLWIHRQLKAVMASFDFFNQNLMTLIILQ